MAAPSYKDINILEHPTVVMPLFNLLRRQEIGATGDRAAQGSLYLDLGTKYFKLGQTAKAIELCEDALRRLLL